MLADTIVLVLYVFKKVLLLMYACKYVIESLLITLIGMLPTQPGSSVEAPQISRVAFVVEAADPEDLDERARWIFKLTNAYRLENDLKKLKLDERLNKAAKAHAATLIETGEFTHEAGGTQPHQRVAKAKYKWHFVAENLAWRMDLQELDNKVFAEKTIEQWKNSPGHNKNLLHKMPIQTGIAVVKDEETNRYYSVVLYARPR